MERPVARDPIAIIGMGCRLPGADSVDRFWTLLRDGVDAIGELPLDRFDIDTLFDPRPGTPGAVVTRAGGFLPDIDRFDPLFFGISPREAAVIDPQQRLLLEVAWEALDDAGMPRAALAGCLGGVFVAMWTNEYEDRLLASREDLDVHVATGSGRYTAAGRLSNFFDLRGPSLTVDTACSSSLVAVHLACEALRNHQVPIALAGSANLILHPFISIGYSKSGMLSPDGRCKFGDARANGYVRSEGVAAVVLKRLADALSDGDPVRAVIRGTTVNNDGYSNAELMKPSTAGQAALLRQAYRDAGISPGDVDYIEAHGTGTSVGDPIELQALGEVLAQDRPADRPCRVGSVKTNIGHTEATAGLAGLLKVVLALQHREIPASLHFEQPNPNIPWQQLQLAIQRERGPWPSSGATPTAGVSAFGVTGTNAHVILQQAPEQRADAACDDRSAEERILTLSAQSVGALDGLAARWVELTGAGGDMPPLADVCYTAAVGRDHHDERLAVIGRSPAELHERLAAALRGDEAPGVVRGTRDRGATPRVAFVFPGQGSQWAGMGRRLLAREPAFREAMEACDRAIRDAAAWSVLEMLEGTVAGAERTEFIQPVLFSVQVALAALWRSWGLLPAAVVGHSMGEIAAAHVAGALTLEDSARLICYRSRLLGRTEGQGAMAVVELSTDEASATLAGYEDQLSIAVSNSSRSTVISGAPGALDRLVAELEAKDVFCRRVQVDVAAHSPQIEPLRPELVERLAKLAPAGAALSIYSTVTGDAIDGTALDAAYWGRNLREPVIFAAAVHRMLGDGYDTFVEISPHPILLPAMQQELQQLGSEALVVASLRREEERSALLGSLAALYTRGVPIDWKAFYGEGGRCVPLPSYPWQRERFWCNEPPVEGRGAQRGSASGSRRGRLIGDRITSSLHAGTYLWERTISLDELPFLADHRVGELVVMPAAGFLGMALQASAEVFGDGRIVTLCDVELEAALPLRSDEETTVQLVLTAEGPNAASFAISSLDVGTADDRERQWTRHAAGTLTAVARDAVDVAGGELAVAEPGDAIVSRDDHYRSMRRHGLPYGPAFRGVEQLWSDGEHIWGRTRHAADLPIHSSAAGFGPSVLDACLQILLAALVDSPAVPRDATFVPVGLEKLRLLRQPPAGNALAARATRRPGGTAIALEGDLLVLTEKGVPIAEIVGARFQRLGGDRDDYVEQSLYELRWEPVDLPEPVADDDGDETCLLLTDDAGVGARLQRRIEEAGRQCVVARLSRDPATHPSGTAPDPGGLRRRLGSVATATDGRLEVICVVGGNATIEDSDAMEASVSICTAITHLVQALTSVEQVTPARLWLVTSGAHAVAEDDAPADPVQTSAWGLGRTISSEHPELDCRRIDLPADPTVAELDTLSRILLSPGDEDEFALRGASCRASRLRRFSERPSSSASPPAGPADAAVLAAREIPFRIVVDDPGVLDSLIAVPATCGGPGEGQVEIDVQAAGLNFMNVMSAMGIYPGYPDGVGPLGIECAGIVSAVGPGVDGLRAGDEVVALVDDLASRVIADARLVARKPAGLELEAAAAVPAAFVTAYHALIRKGDLHAGESVLIHSATGGVGLAALQLARHVGAVVYATAGSEEKRELLRSQGIEHVMDSRSLDFADEILDATQGRGVDVVLNSLAGPAIEKGLTALAAHGRFLEIGKRDIYDNARLGLSPFRKGLTYCAIDVLQMCRERPALVGELLREVVEMIDDGILEPLPQQVFPAARAADAFRLMARAQHVGKIVISLRDRTDLVVSPRRGDVRLGEGTYLITGGLGDLGLGVARRMFEKGARNLALVGRGEGSAAARAAVEGLRRAGAEVRVMAADVSDRSAIEAVVREVDETMPPLRGIIHAAGVLDDAVIANTERDHFVAVMAPKVAGAWNLHETTAEMALDLFVMFSSSAALLGLSGQGNYAAANAFMDGLAHLRRAQRRPALSINWGPWAEVGLAASRGDRGVRLAEAGMLSYTPADGLQAFESLLMSGCAQAAAMPMDWARFHRATGSMAAGRRFERLIAFAGDRADREDGSRPESTDRDLRARLLACEPGRNRRGLLEGFLKGQVAQILRLDAARLGSHTPLRDFGLDSLMGLELRNRLEAALELSLPGTLVYNYPTIGQLAPHLGRLVQIPLDGDESGAAAESCMTPEDAELAELLAELDDLSPEEVRRLLTEQDGREASDG